MEQLMQVKRVAIERKLPEEKVKALVEKFIIKPKFIGIAVVNVLELNIALDELKNLN